MEIVLSQRKLAANTTPSLSPHYFAPTLEVYLEDFELYATAAPPHPPLPCGPFPPIPRPPPPPSSPFATPSWRPPHFTPLSRSAPPLTTSLPATSPLPRSSWPCSLCSKDREAMAENGVGGEAATAGSRWLERLARMRGRGWRRGVVAESGAASRGWQGRRVVAKPDYLRVGSRVETRPRARSRLPERLGDNAVTGEE